MLLMNSARSFRFFAFASIVTMVGFVNADGTVDGQRGANYGSALAVQTVETEFGDNFSELNAAYGYSENGILYLMLTGNLEQNFNKLNLFFDVGSGSGENVLSGTPDYDFFDGTNWISSNYAGHTFDSGFNADYHMYARSGGGDDYRVDFIDRLGGGSTIINGNTGSAVGLGTVGKNDLADNAGASALNNDISFFFDNSNTAGVLGGTAAADQAAAAAVTTGFEFAIDLADLGLDKTADNTIRVAAIIGNGDHNFHSNQTLGGLAAPQGNLGGDGAGGFTGDLSGINFNDFAGDQFFTVNTSAVPEPGSLVLICGVGLAVCLRRRR